MNEYLPAIIGMALATQLPRLIPALTGTKKIRSRYMSRFLSSIPLAALGTLIIPGIFSVGDSMFTGLVGGLVSLVLAFKRVNIMLNIVISSLIVSFLIYFI